MRPDLPRSWRGTLSRRDGELLLSARHWDPFSVLGPHRARRGKEEDGTAVRAFLPRASEARLLAFPGTAEERAVPMERLWPEGIFEAFLPGAAPDLPYRLEAREGEAWRAFHDPYAFGTVVSDYDLHLAAEGSHLSLHQVLGSHVRSLSGVAGVSFAVWAPNAERVSVVGDFNGWDGRCHAMRSRGGSGIWEIFVPALAAGEVYKYEIRVRATGEILLKADPFGFRFEHPPKTGTVVCDLSGYRWGDGAWMEARKGRDPLSSPMSVYEVHVGSWRRGEGNRYLTWDELAEQLVPYAVEGGFTHLELLPVTEHPFDGSWGYQTTGYFAPTARHGAPEGFKRFVDACHGSGLGVILDWVPAHFPRDGHALARFDGTCLYEHEDPRKGEHRDWGTLIFNYDRREVSAFLLSSALFWLEEYHVDGLRVDAVASMLYLDYSREPGDWIPNEFGGRENLGAIAFLRRMNEQVHGRCPGAVTVAEESTAWPMVSRPVYAGGLGFTLKWNMGWMHDMLRFMQEDPVHRKYHFGTLTFSLLYAFHENFVLPFSHDEVVHLKGAMAAKMPGDDWRKFANLRLLYAYMHAHPGKKLLFMGCEFGAWTEWDHDRPLPWDNLLYPNHGGMRRLVSDLNRLHRELAPLHEEDFSPSGFEWIDFHDAEQSVVSFLRRGRDRADLLACAFNFTPVERRGYRVGLPEGGRWTEILNTDGADYWGSGQGNGGSVTAEGVPWNGRPFSAVLTLPPLAALYLRPER